MKEWLFVCARAVGRGCFEERGCVDSAVVQFQFRESDATDRDCGCCEVATMVGTPVASREARQFNVYQSAGIAAAFSALSMRPAKRELTIIAVLCFLSASICGVTFWYSLLFFGLQCQCFATLFLNLSRNVD